MPYLTKLEVLECLQKMTFRITSIIQNPSDPNGLYMYSIPKDPTNQEEVKEANKDFDVYLLLSLLRYFSYYEDAFIDEIDDKDLDFSKLRDHIFFNKKDANRFSNKQIIRYIRDGFSHNEGEKEIYKIARDGSYIDFDMKKTKPVPFHIRLYQEDLITLMESFNKVDYVFYMNLIDEDNKVLKRVYANGKKATPAILEKIQSKLAGSSMYQIFKNVYDKILSILDQEQIPYEIKEYPLTKEQKEMIKQFQKRTEYLDKNNQQLDFIRQTLMDYLFSEITPLQVEKMAQKFDTYFFVSLLHENPMASFKDILKEYEKAMNHLLNPKEEVEEIPLRICEIINDFPRIGLMNSKRIFENVAMEYITYYLSVIEKQDTKENEHLRNSVTHGRWFIDNDGNIHFFDAPNGKKNDYNFDWTYTINIMDLIIQINKEIKKAKEKRKDSTHC